MTPHAPALSAVLAAAMITLVAPLAPAPALAQQISTQGPGDGCAPDYDGRVHTGCLRVMHNLAGSGAAPAPTGWIAIDAEAALPAATPMEAIVPLVDMPFDEEGWPEQRFRLTAAGHGVVDFIVTSTGWADDSTAGAEWAGRLVRNAQGAWQMLQLDQRYLCHRGVSEQDRCL